MACQHLEQCNTAVTLRDVPDAADTGAKYGILATYKQRNLNSSNEASKSPPDRRAASMLPHANFARICSCCKNCCC